MSELSKERLEEIAHSTRDREFCTGHEAAAMARELLALREQAEPTRQALRELVDAVWQTAKESEEVPATAWADEIIDGIISVPSEPVSQRYEQPALGAGKGVG